MKGCEFEVYEGGEARQCEKESTHVYAGAFLCKEHAAYVLGMYDIKEKDRWRYKIDEDFQDEHR